MRGEAERKQSTEAVDDALRGQTVRGARRATRMVAANVTAEELAEIQAHAKRGGYRTIAEYLRTIALTPVPKYDTDAARVARPLVQLSDKIRHALDVLDRNEADAVRGYLLEMKAIIHGALSPLRREHDAEVRASQ